MALDHKSIVGGDVSRWPREKRSMSVDSTERDRNALRRLGKKPVLKRNFGFVSILGFCSLLLITWEAVVKVGVKDGLANGGPGGLIIQFLVAWIGVTASFVTISEMASMAPTSGGQFHWVSILSPPWCQTFLSYATGWLTLCGWQAIAAGTANVAGRLFEAVATLTDPDYEAQSWHLLLITWAVITVSVLINVRGGTLLPKFESFMLLLHVFGFFAVMIPLVTLSPKMDASFVFGSFSNAGSFPTQGLSTMVGMIGMLWVLSGADGAIHMAEEIANAPIVVPRAIVTTYLLNGTLGFAMLLALLFATQDPQAALAAPVGYPFIYIFYKGTNSMDGTKAMVAILITMQIACTTSVIAAASRQLWSFARDHGVPGWRLLSRVEQKTSVPAYAVCVTALVSAALSLLNLGTSSSSAFDAISDLGIAGAYSSYLISASLLLYRRLDGSIMRFTYSDKTLSNAVGAKLTWGPWHVPGIFGIALNIFVCCFLTFAFFFSFWPSTMSVTPSSMNYNSLLWGTVVLLSLGYYALRGRREYSGPIVEADDESILNLRAFSGSV